MKKTIVAGIGCALFSMIALADNSWFAVVGDRTESQEDSAELNLEGIGSRATINLMQLRVNYQKVHVLAGGERYFSYRSTIEIDCTRNSIVYLSQTRFTEPRWQGISTFENFSGLRPMAFNGFEPSPKLAVLKAACTDNRIVTAR